MSAEGPQKTGWGDHQDCAWTSMQMGRLQCLGKKTQLQNAVRSAAAQGKGRQGQWTCRQCCVVGAEGCAKHDAGAMLVRFACQHASAARLAAWSWL